jgi:hypothetical protein
MFCSGIGGKKGIAAAKIYTLGRWNPSGGIQEMKPARRKAKAAGGTVP